MERIRYKAIATALIILSFYLPSCEDLQDFYDEIQSIEEGEDYQNEQSLAKSLSENSDSIKICSQNIGRLGDIKKSYSLKLKYLVSLMSKHNCSVVALQEVVSDEVAKDLAKELSKQSNREFRSYLGKSRDKYITCLLYTSPSPRDATLSRMPSSA